MARIAIGTMLKTASTMSGEQRNQYMRDNWSPAVGEIIRHAVNPFVQFLLPEGTPPFRPAEDYPGIENVLHRSVRIFYIFVKGQGDYVPQSKREMQFITLLETIPPDDVEVILAMKDKKLPFGLTWDIIDEAYPGLLAPEWKEAPSQDGDQFSAEGDNSADNRVVASSDLVANEPPKLRGGAAAKARREARLAQIEAAANNKATASTVV